MAHQMAHQLGRQVIKNETLTALNMSKYGVFASLACAAAFTLSACGNPGSTYSLKSGAQFDGGIIGGTVASSSDPFTGTVVALANVKQGTLCSGSILTQDIILTAAHCVENMTTGQAVDPSELVVIFGQDITSLFDQNAPANPNLQGRRVIATIEAPGRQQNQNNELNESDIALIKMSNPIPAGYQPATLLADASALTNGGSVILAGYGITDGVKKTGDGVLRYVDVTVQNVNYSSTEVLFDQTQGKGACHGDSGGPAYVTVNGQYMLFGVTSRGVNDPKNTCGGSAAYTNLLAFNDWINSAVPTLEKAQAPTQTSGQATGSSSGSPSGSPSGDPSGSPVASNDGN